MDIGIQINLLTGLLLTALGLCDRVFFSSSASSEYSNLLQLFSLLVGVFMGLVIFGLISRGVLGLDWQPRDSTRPWIPFSRFFGVGQWPGSRFVPGIDLRRRNPVPVRHPVDKRPLNTADEAKAKSRTEVTEEGFRGSEKAPDNEPVSRVPAKDRPSKSDLKNGRERLFSVVDLRWGKAYECGEGGPARVFETLACGSTGGKFSPAEGDGQSCGC